MNSNSFLLTAAVALSLSLPAAAGPTTPRNAFPAHMKGLTPAPTAFHPGLVFRNNPFGDPTFELPEEAVFATGDVNGDGLDDAVFFMRGSTGWVYVALNHGAGGFVRADHDNRAHHYFSPGRGTVFVDDANADGYDDLECIANQAGDVRLVAGDFDGDGSDDVAQILDYMSSTGTLRSRIWIRAIRGLTLPSSGYSTDLVARGDFQHISETPQAADINGDGRDDLVIDHPLLNGNPHARILVTPLTHKGNDGVGNYGAWYDGSRWTIYREDVGDMKGGLAFNVLLDPDSSQMVGHLSTSQNIEGNRTVLKHPSLDGNPEAGFPETVRNQGS